MAWKRWMVLIAAGSALSAGRPGGAAEPVKHLCSAGERVLWSCAVRKGPKVASVCASPDLTADRGYVRYLFGTSAKVEMEFPDSRDESQEHFVYSRYTRPLTTFLALRFENAGYTYTLFQQSSDEEEPSELNYIQVKAPGQKKGTDLHCRAVRGSLAELEDVVPASPEWILN